MQVSTLTLKYTPYPVPSWELSYLHRNCEDPCPDSFPGSASVGECAPLGLSSQSGSPPRCGGWLWAEAGATVQAETACLALWEEEGIRARPHTGPSLCSRDGLPGVPLPGCGQLGHQPPSCSWRKRNQTCCLWFLSAAQGPAMTWGLIWTHFPLLWILFSKGPAHRLLDQHLTSLGNQSPGGDQW